MTSLKTSIKNITYLSDIGCLEIQGASLDVLSGYGFASYRVKFPGVAEITEEHPPKRQQQAAAAKAPEITPFTS